MRPRGFRALGERQRLVELAAAAGGHNLLHIAQRTPVTARSARPITDSALGRLGSYLIASDRQLGHPSGYRRTMASRAITRIPDHG
jgi:hypothetical protein